jgi:hypothetical protein
MQSTERTTVVTTHRYRRNKHIDSLLLCNQPTVVCRSVYVRKNLLMKKKEEEIDFILI